tara:strand:+ start:126 stop:797 length:672 start_codon:yes stop_codon:yes gene_type:complete
MACEHAVLIEPVTPVVYTNKRPQCKLFSLLVVALCVISFIGFVTHIKAFVYELKTEIANLKDDNQRVANKVEAMNISELQTEIAKLKDDNQRLANKVESINISELSDGLDEVKDDNQRLANKVESINISQFNMEIIKLKTEIAKLKEEDIHLWDEAWRQTVPTLGQHHDVMTSTYKEVKFQYQQYCQGCQLGTPWQYRERVLRSRSEDKTAIKYDDGLKHAGE